MPSVRSGKGIPGVVTDLICLIRGEDDPSHMEVSKNRGTPKWMVYNGKPY